MNRPIRHRRPRSWIFILTGLALAACGDGATGPEGTDPMQDPPPADDPEPFFHTLSPGASARDFLSDERFDRLRVEIDYVEGMAPSQEALDSLELFLERRLNKPGGITISLDDSIASPGQEAYSTADVRALEDAHRGTFTEDGTLAAYFLFLDAAFEQGNVLGIAYFNTSMALFEQVIRDNTGGIGQPETELIETTTTRHEFGHILGLVNNGAPMQGSQDGPDDHHDEANGAHCTVEGSLMYFQVETTDFLANLIGGSVPQLEPLDIADLQASGGK